MKGWTIKILFILISISFVIAVFEIDIGRYDNTFFDEYDTYVQGNNQNVELSSHFEQQKDLAQEYYDFAIKSFNLFLSNTQADSNSPPQKENLFISQKIFIRNSAWRI